VAVFVVAGWVMPETNQRYRDLSAHINNGPDVRLARGWNELPLGELRIRGAIYPFHQRLALSCAPFVLTLFVASLSTWRRRWALVFGFVALVVYFLLMYSFHRPKVWPALSAWTPDLTFALATLLLFTLSRRRAPHRTAGLPDQILK
jgi:lipopolysaccharide export LptBFGC system permease protein LptF